VHAKQNFFHFDADVITDTDKGVYHLNAILPADIVVKSIRQVADDAHSRFDAVPAAINTRCISKKTRFWMTGLIITPFL
jgi:tRNA pseudouridine(38-40) synthase